MDHYFSAPASDGGEALREGNHGNWPINNSTRFKTHKPGIWRCGRCYGSQSLAYGLGKGAEAADGRPLDVTQIWFWQASQIRSKRCSTIKLQPRGCVYVRRLHTEDKIVATPEVMVLARRLITAVVA